jgi:hypothetical protein
LTQVFITATKRSTSLQKTPVAVTAISSQALDDAHMRAAPPRCFDVIRDTPERDNRPGPHRDGLRQLIDFLSDPVGMAFRK